MPLQAWTLGYQAKQKKPVTKDHLLHLLVFHLYEMARISPSVGIKVDCKPVEENCVLCVSLVSCNLAELSYVFSVVPWGWEEGGGEGRVGGQELKVSDFFLRR